MLNGHDRFEKQEEEYFQLRQPYEYHTTIPQNNLPRHMHHGLLATGEKMISVGPLTHTDGVGLVSVACTDQNLTWVQVDGSSDPLTSLPAASATLSNADTHASCFIVGGLAAASGIVKNSLRVGDEHLIEISNPGGYGHGTHVKSSARRKVSHIILSDLSTVDEISKVSGSYGPVHYVGSGATEGLLNAGGSPGDITNGTGGGILVCYDEVLQFTANPFQPGLESGVDFTTIKNLTPHDSISAGSDPVEATTSLLSKRINVYSFALKPEEHQPSGTCNFSRIDNAELITEGALESTDYIYAVNYNVLRIMSGMGGLAYSN